jgi:hypothetical protein
MKVFFSFHSQIYIKIKNIHREIKSVHWHFGSSIRKNLLCISYKKGGIEEIKSTQIEFFH